MAKILVVDDELMVCDLLRTVLARRGYEVITTTDPREAAGLYQQHRPDVTLLDLAMPEVDGIGVLKDIHALDPQAAVMMLTGRGSEEMETRARQLGVTDFLRKGFSLEVLVKTMDRVLQQSALAPSTLSTGAQAAKGSPASQGGPVILVVDDEEMIRSLLGQFLTLRGYQIRLAQDGSEALAMVAQEPPQMVILDMYMPGMNGVEVLRELRARQYAGGVVALTASQDEKLLQQTLNLGSVDVLGKPVDLERLDLVLQVGLAMTEPDTNPHT